MGRKARESYDPNRKFITKKLLARYLGIHRNSLNAYLKTYGEIDGGQKVDFHNAYQVLDFLLWNFGIFYSHED